MTRYRIVETTVSRLDAATPEEAMAKYLNDEDEAKRAFEYVSARTIEDDETGETFNVEAI